MRRRLVVVGALAAFVAACTIVNGLSVSRSTDPGDSGDAGADVDAFVDPYPCNHHLPPPPLPPTVPQPGGATFVSALTNIDLGIHADGGFDQIGFDLDNRCTCNPFSGGLTPPTCKSPSPDEQKGPCDQDGGVDNAATILFQLAIKFQGADINLEADLNNDLKNGNHGLLIWVEDYNGTDNDEDVGISITISPGTEAGGKPTFQPGEIWKLSDTDTFPVNTGDAGFVPVPGAHLTGLHYVKDGTLVGRGSITIPLIGGLDVTLKDGYVVGDIKPYGGSFYVANGTVTGRAPLAQVLRSIGGVSKPTGSDTHLCDPAQKPSFDTLKSAICGSLDIMESASADNTGATCDAISLGVNFTAVSATPGSQQTLTSVTYCEDADVTCPAL